MFLHVTTVLQFYLSMLLSDWLNAVTCQNKFTTPPHQCGRLCFGTLPNYSIISSSDPILLKAERHRLDYQNILYLLYTNILSATLRGKPLLKTSIDPRGLTGKGQGCWVVTDTKSYVLAHDSC